MLYSRGVADSLPAEKERGLDGACTCSIGMCGSLLWLRASLLLWLRASLLLWLRASLRTAGTRELQSRGPMQLQSRGRYCKLPKQAPPRHCSASLEHSRCTVPKSMGCFTTS